MSKELRQKILQFSQDHRTDFCADYKIGDSILNFGAMPNIINLQSVSKQFIKAAILNLCKSGELDLNTHIVDFIDITRNAKSMVKFYDWSGWGKIRVRHLLAHQSGIVDFINEMHDFDDVQSIVEFEVLRACAKFPLHFEAGSQTLYSNSNYYILSIIIQRITAMTVEDYVFKSIVDKQPYNVSLPVGNIPIKGVLCKSMAWPDYKTLGIFAMSVDDLHNFAFNVKWILPYYKKWFTPAYSLMKHGNFAKFHTQVGASDTGNITVHCFDAENRISVVMFCNAYSELIYNDFIEIGNEILGTILTK